VERVTLGDFEMQWLSDGHYLLDGGAMFGIIPKPLWEKKTRADSLNRIRLGLNSLLIRTGDHQILIETGIGPKLSEKMQRIYENQPRLLESFAAAGVDPAEIDIVINTHLHFDHCGWNTMRRGDRIVPTFPNARYYVQAGEVEHAHEQHERDRVSYMTDNYDPLVQSGQMQLLHGNQEIVPGISVQIYPGHTRALQAVMIESGGRKACYISDLIPTRAHMDVIWVMAYDLYPMESIESRKQFYAQALPENWLVFFTHDPDDPWAYVGRDEKGKYVARSLQQQTTAAPAPSQGARQP
jgi:glyoxylase-like metal-dependent hydrolase (beta-lactamase superfamily II)